jgi:hypothetical protein
MRRLGTLVPVFVSLAMMLAAATAAQAIGLPAPTGGSAPLVDSSFTYQGQLKGPSGPVNAVCNFRFTLWNDSSAGGQIGVLDTRNGVTVANGLFTAVLNTSSQFGPNAFNGEARWLAISVQCPGDPGFVLLNPRQALTATPYALSLRPGAVVSGSNGGPTLSLLNPGGEAARLDGDVRLDGDLLKDYGAAPQRALPIAFGSISFTATIRSATANVSSVITSTTNFLHYVVTITGETYDIQHYVTVVTPGFGCDWTPMTGGSGGKLWIAFLEGGGNLCNFSFVTYKP